jgi:hypothetical protein
VENAGWTGRLLRDGLRARLFSGRPCDRPGCASSTSCFWCLLTREEDYAYAQPSLTQKKLRRLELAAGAPKGAGGAGVWSSNKAMREAERALARQAEAAYEAHRRRLDQAAATEKGRRRDNGARNLKSPI